MKDKVRCKACGYILDKDALGEVCPACGVKKEMFEPWEDKVGALRRLYLELDLHPVIVHAPQALTFILLLLSVTFPLFGADLQAKYLVPTIVVLVWLLPFTIVATIITGMMDAMVRYRKIASPALLTKQILGYIFAAASVVLVVLVSNGALTDLSIWLSFVAANVVAMAVSAILGIRGAKLTHGAMPGDKVFMKKKKKVPASGAPAKAAAKPEAPKAESKPE